MAIILAGAGVVFVVVVSWLDSAAAGVVLALAWVVRGMSLQLIREWAWREHQGSLPSGASVRFLAKAYRAEAIILGVLLVLSLVLRLWWPALIIVPFFVMAGFIALRAPAEPG